MEHQRVAIWSWVSKVRTAMVWLVVFALMNMFTADCFLTVRYPGGFLPPWAPRPTDFEWLLWWRNLALILTVTFALISIPRWQSLVGIGALIIFFAFWAGN